MAVAYLLPHSTVGAATKWRTTYYANQEPFASMLPLSEVPWQKYTHVIQGFIVPTNIGDVPGIDTAGYNIESNAEEFVRLAHQNKVKALVSLIVGKAHVSAMENNTADSVRMEKFIVELTTFVTKNNYDGIDIDWEAPTNNFNTQFPEFIKQLRAALPDKIITIAGSIYFRHVYAFQYQDGTGMRLYDKVDQINLMNYDMDGSTYGGSSSITWFNTSVKMGPLVFDHYYIDSTTGQRIYSNNKTQEEDIMYMESAKIPAAKLGLGLPFYGHIKQARQLNSTDGVTAPRQSYATLPPIEIRTQIGYSQLITGVIDPVSGILKSRLHDGTLVPYYWLYGVRLWDEVYKAPYISYNVADSAQDAFVTYTDPQQIGDSIKLVNAKGLGGIMTFVVNHEYLADKIEDDRYPLTMAIAADLSVTITSAPGSVWRNDTLTYVVTVANTGPSQAMGVSIFGISGCVLPITLDSGTSATCTSSVTARTAGLFRQSVTVSADGYDSNTDNNSASTYTIVRPRPRYR